MSDPWRTLEALLAARIGLDPSTVGPSLIRRAVRLRMEESGLDDLDAYARRAGSDESELQALVEEVVIPESWFFRDDRPFRALREHAGPRWLGDPARAPLRVLSLPCAGGEEPYSAAIALREIGLAPDRFRIDAVDVSRRQVERASRGVFSRNAFRGPDLSYRDRHFRAVPGGFEIAPELRAAVSFSVASALDPALPEGRPPYDVILCRNLLIYLDAASRGRVLANLDRMLAPDGLLIVGHADRLGGEAPDRGPRLVPAGGPGSFAYRRAGPPPGPGPAASPAPARPRASTPPRAASPPRPAPSRPPAPPPASGPRPTPDRPPGPEPAGGPAAPSSLLDEASALANRGKADHPEALALCERHLRLRGPDPAAYHLMGVILQAGGDLARAEACFHKAVYLDPAHDEALLALSLLADRRGDASAAAGLRRRAERALRKNQGRTAT